MAVKIRLKRLGKIRSPHYRIVVMDSRAKRDGRAIEEIGKYHPKNNPSFIEVKSERAQYWLGVGAQPTEAVVALFKRSGDWQQFSGDTSASGIDPQPERRDKLAAYNAAVADTIDAGLSTAISGKKKSDDSDKTDAAKAEADKPEADKPTEAAGDTEKTGA